MPPTSIESLVSVLRDVARALRETVNGEDIGPATVEQLLDEIDSVMALPEVAEVNIRFTLEELEYAEDD